MNDKPYNYKELRMKGKVRLNAVGDLMLGDFPLTLGFGVRSSIREKIDGNPFNKIKHVLMNCDICFGNLETVLSDYGLKNNDIKSAQMRGDPCFVELLKDAGFNVMSIANNHAMQHGPEAFIETKEGLIQGGIAPIGIVGANRRVVPHFMEVNCLRVCFLGYSLRPEKYCPQILYAQPNVWEIVEDIKLNKARSDIVIVSLHWGDEFVQLPSPEQIRSAHSFIDAGASLVIGHHPHMVQGIERYKDGVIAYSLGNFIFDYWQNKLRKTIILHCELSIKGVESFDITTAYIGKDFNPIVLYGSKSNALSLMVDSLSKKIEKIDTNSYKQERKYLLSVKTGLLINKVQNRIYFLKNIFKYERWVVIQSIRNFINLHF